MPLLNRSEENKDLAERQEGRMSQAEKVEALRVKILALREANLPVPQELTDELRNEASKLIGS